jgi:hypothetical protein
MAGAGSWSTDVADVSWVVPTGGMSAATWVPGTATHSWQAVAAGGTTIGEKGMAVAAKALAMTAVDLLTDPGLIERATGEYRERLPSGWTYEPLLGDRPPPLDYRNAVGPLTGAGAEAGWPRAASRRRFELRWYRSPERTRKPHRCSTCYASPGPGTWRAR